jgi:hypothetical protein
MSSEPSSDLKFEIGHVLFIDILGYSRLLIHQQSEQLQKLKEIVRGRSNSVSPKQKVNCDPLLDDLRGQQRFEALVQEVVGDAK